MDDIAYPEKYPQKEQIKLVGAVGFGHLYRLMRSMYIILERKFKFIAPKLEGIGKRFDGFMASRKLKGEAGEEEELRLSEAEKKEKLKKLEEKLSA